MNAFSRAGILQVLKGGAVVGAAFLIDERLVLTCAHVIERADTILGGTISLCLADGATVNATVMPEYWRESKAEDVAILQLDAPLAGVPILELGSSTGTWGHAFSTYGFPKPDQELAGRGEIIGNAILDSISYLQLSSPQVTPGFSGAPVFDEVTRRVVGMVAAITPLDEYQRQGTTAFAVPAETIFKICPDIQPSDICPYRRLDIFRENDAEFFFGRQSIVNRLLESLRREPRFLAVLGPSGSGKSSVVQAGLIPQLRKGQVSGSDKWTIIVTRPANILIGQYNEFGKESIPEGLTEYKEHLKDLTEQNHLLLIIDQFEELLIMEPVSLLVEFVNLIIELLETSQDITFIIVMRDDFYSRLSQRAYGLLPWVEKSLVNIPLELTSDELKDIIQEPARKVGMEFETGLVELIIDDVIGVSYGAIGKGRIGRSTTLPLLEFALTQLWELRQNGLFTHEAYNMIGGVIGGLSRWADHTYYGLDKSQRSLARHILTYLVYLGNERQGLPDCRVQRSLNELVNRDNNLFLIVQQLVAARLVATTRESQNGQEIIELIHEALIWEWGLLHNWIQEDRRFLKWRQETEDRVRSWSASLSTRTNLRDDDLLLQGQSLAEAESWLSERTVDLSRMVVEYIQESIAKQKENKEARERIQRKVIYIAFITSIVLLLLSALSIIGWRIAENRRQEVMHQQTIAASRQLLTEAQMSMDYTGKGLLIGSLLAAESMKTYPSVEADITLRNSLALLPTPLNRMEHEGVVTNVSFSFDGKFLITAGGGGLYGISDWGEIHVWDFTSGREITSIKEDSMIIDMDLSPNQHLVASGSLLGTARVWDMITGKEISHVRHEYDTDNNVNDIEFSPNGKLVASGGNDNVRVWNAVTGEEIAQLDSRGYSIAFSPDGSKLAAGGDDSIIIWDILSREKMIRLVHGDVVNSVVFSPDGKWLLSGSDDKTARLWETDTWREVYVKEHEGIVFSTIFSPDGNFFAASSSPGLVRVWNTTSGDEISRMRHNGAVYSIVFSPDGNLIASAGSDSTARIWGATTGKEINRAVHGYDFIVTSFAFSPDGNSFVTGSSDKTARVWKIVTGQEVVNIKNEGKRYAPISFISFSPDKQKIASFGDNILRVWDISTGNELFYLEQEEISELIISPNWRWVAFAGFNGTLQVQELITGQKIIHNGPGELYILWLLTRMNDG